MKSELQKFIESTVDINVKKEYWYIRTDGGYYYDIFRENNFVALGWNEITVEDIRNSLIDPASLKKKLERVSRSFSSEQNPIDLDTLSGRKEATMIVHKLQHFYNLKKNDIVVIPDVKSRGFSFGYVNDIGISVESVGKYDCEYKKRRNIKWVAHKSFDELDKAFYTLKKSMHSISSVKVELEDHIDRVMNDLFFKNGYGHFVIRVGKKEDIKADELFELGKDLVELLKIINEKYGFNEPIDETFVKINVQSEGIFSLKGLVGRSVVTLGAILTMSACNPGDIKPGDIPGERAQEILDSISSKFDSLQVDLDHRND